MLCDWQVEGNIVTQQQQHKKKLENTENVAFWQLCFKGINERTEWRVAVFLIGTNIVKINIVK